MLPRGLLAPLAALLLSASSAQPLHVITRSTLDRPIGADIEVHSAPRGSLDAADALKADGWVRAGVPVPNLGISGDDHWLRTQLFNRTGIDELVISVPYWEIDQMEAFVVWNDRLEQVALVGQAVPAQDRVGDYPELAFNLRLPHEASATLLIRIHGVKQLLAPVTVTTAPQLLANRSDRSLVIGAFAGIMIFLVLYNFFVFLGTRDMGYLNYVLYILTLFFAQLTLLGVGQAHLWEGSPWFASHASVIFTLLSMLFAGFFTRHFLDVRSFSPRMDRILMAMMLVIGATLAAYAGGARLLGYQVAQVLIGTYSLFLIALAVSAHRNGSRGARFFLVAWGFFLAGVVTYIMRDVGVLSWNYLTTYAIPLGSVLEGVLLSFALADRINTLRMDKERSRAEALAALQENARIILEQNAMLESKVRERTAALQESNDTLKRTQVQLVQSEKMASIGQLTAGIAHEINNPINFITSNIGPLRRNLSEVVETINAYRKADSSDAVAQVRTEEERAGIHESIEELNGIIASVSEGANRTAEIVRGLRNFSRLDEDDLKLADLNEGVRSTLAVLAPEYRGKVELALDLGKLPEVECFPGKINQVLMNVMNNAAQATLARMDGRPRTVTVTTSATDHSAIIRITDTGVGMSEAIKAKIFEPFFTTKAVGEGTGLGLAIVYGIITEHEGSIEVESQPGEGSTFTITLPLLRARQLEQRA